MSLSKQLAIGCALLVAVTGLPKDTTRATEDRTTAQSTRGLYLQLIRQVRADNRPRAALAYLDDFEKKYAGDLDAKILRINCLLDLGDVAAAKEVVDSLPKNSRTPSDVVETARGHVLAAKGQWIQASQRYQIASGINPTDPNIRNALGYAQLRSGEIDLAIVSLRSAADLSPNSEVIRNNTLLAFELSGNTREFSNLLSKIRDASKRQKLQMQTYAEAKRLRAQMPTIRQRTGQ